MKKLLLLGMIFFNLFLQAKSQVKIGPNPASISPFSVLELEGTQKGLLLPRIATATDLAVMSGAPEGMIVYFIPDGSLYIKQSSAWVKVTGNWITTGTHIYNENTGNVGIGNNSPTHGKLEVSTFVGNVAGMFGNGTNSGISLNGGFPEVGYNYYFNSGNYGMAPGYAAVSGLNPINGDYYIGNFNGNQAPAPYSPINGYTDRIILRQNGNVGIGVASPSVKLDIAGSFKFNGRLTNNPTGNANLAPIAYGKVKFDGTILSGTGNFSVVKVGNGDFEISINGETNLYNDSDQYMVFTSASATNTGNAITVHDFRVNNTIGVTEGGIGSISYSNSGCVLCTNSPWSYINNGNPMTTANVNFNFIVFKY
jgi:hypothetical protein